MKKRVRETSGWFCELQWAEKTTNGGKSTKKPNRKKKPKTGNQDEVGVAQQSVIGTGHGKGSH